MADPPRLSHTPRAQQRAAIGLSDDSQHLDWAAHFDAGARRDLGCLSDHLLALLVHAGRLERQQRADRSGVWRARPPQSEEGRRNGDRGGALSRHHRRGFGLDRLADDPRLARHTARHLVTIRRLRAGRLPDDADLLRLFRLYHDSARHRRFDDALLRVDRLEHAGDRRHPALHRGRLWITEAGRGKRGGRGINR